MNIIGIDISKDKFHVTWLRDMQTGKVKNKQFPNTAKGHAALVKWAQQQIQGPIESLHFVMEATGGYHEALAEALFNAGAPVSVVNPAQIKHYAKSLGARSKTDKKDSQTIARFGATQPLRLWQPEAEEIRLLRALITRFEALGKDIQRENNRLEKAAMTGISAEVYASIQTVLSQLQKEQRRIEALINQHIVQHPHLKQDRQLLETIPGVGPIISRLMLAVIHSRHFDSAPQCAAYLGLVPVQHESGRTVRGKSRLSKAGDARIRAKLYMAAIVCIQHNPDIKIHYERLLKNGKVKMSALCAAMRKLVHICFGVLKHQKPYQPQAL